MTSDDSRVRLAMLGLTFAAYPATGLLAAVIGMPVHLWPILKLLMAFTVPMILIGLYCGRRGVWSLQALTETFACGVALTPPIILSTYLAMRCRMPMADDRLLALDAILPIDRVSFIRFVDAHPLLETALNYGYQSFSVQLLLLPLILSLSGRGGRAYAMVLCYGLICFASSIIAVWFPALGAYVAHGPDQTSLVHIKPFFATFFLDQFDYVRNDPDMVFSILDTAGILTFPSVHAAVAVLCGWAAFGLRPIRYPMMLLNMAMALSTISHGSHYVVDVLAGAALSAGCIFAVKRIDKGFPGTVVSPPGGPMAAGGMPVS